MKDSKLFKIINTMLIVATLSAVPACANSQKGGRDGRQGPPPEAYTACEGQSEGDTVSFEGREGESIEATCKLIDDQLVAVPEGHPQRRQ